MTEAKTKQLYFINCLIITFNWEKKIEEQNK